MISTNSECFQKHMCWKYRAITKLAEGQSGRPAWSLPCSQPFILKRVDRALMNTVTISGFGWQDSRESTGASKNACGVTR